MNDSTNTPPAQEASPEKRSKKANGGAEVTEAPSKTLATGQSPVQPPQPQEASKRKIAILGSAVSSVALAPFMDKTWEIWGCSPANRDLPRVDVWFELHNVELKKREGLTEWMKWLSNQPYVFMQQGPSQEFPKAREFPLSEMVRKYGRYWWTSQIAFMLAAAIEQSPDTIGIYGVDMAANSEYNQQRLACQFFIMKAVELGIKIIVPPESDLLEPAPIYGYCESSRQYRKYIARSQELQTRIGQCRDKRAKMDAEEKHLVGALDDLEYNMAHWGNRPDFFV